MQQAKSTLIDPDNHSGRLESILESVDAAIVTIDARGIIIDCNTATTRLFGHEYNDLLGSNVKCLMPNPYRDQHDGYLHHHLSTGEKRIIGIGREVTGLRKNGSEFPLHLSVGKFEEDENVFFTGIIHDITELRSAHQSATRGARIIAESDQEIYTFLVDSLTFSSVNPAALKNLGYTLSDMYDKTPMDIVSGLTESVLRKTLLSLTQQDTSRLQLNQRFIRKSGEIYQADVNLYLSPNTDPLECVVVVQDVTERNLMLRSLRQSQRMESIGNLTGGVAHDFNNILTVVMGNLELLSLSIDDAAETELLDEAQAAAQMGARLTDRLLTFAKRGKLSPQRFNVNACISDLVEMLSRTIGSGIVLKTVLADRLHDVSVDISEFENALINLSINARDAMPGGGTLLLETFNIELDADSIIGREIKAGSYVSVEVTDTGVGIPKSLIDTIFEPFVSTKSGSEGTGLGLSIVYGFVKQSGGEISVYSEAGVGTTFTLHLPAIFSGDTNDVSPVQVVDDSPLPRKRILVVEDDIPVRRLSVRRLKELGHMIVEATDGFEALELFEKHADEFDCVFSDIVMSKGMTGYDLAQRIRRTHPDMPILLTSGYAEDVINEEKLIESKLSLIRKPYGQQELKDALRALFLGARRD